MSMKGYFKPLNPGKYKGDPTQIVYRSSWELQYMRELDMLANVIEWSSEETVIRYPDPFHLYKYRRYFVDFKVKLRMPDGKIITRLIEIKPHAQTIPPKITKTKRGSISKPYYTYVINQSKWKAAKEYCDKRGWEFSVITEKHVPSWVKK